MKKNIRDDWRILYNEDGDLVMYIDPEDPQIILTVHTAGYRFPG